jgi:hypothetical protein
LASKVLASIGLITQHASCIVHHASCIMHLMHDASCICTNRQCIMHDASMMHDAWHMAPPTPTPFDYAFTVCSCLRPTAFAVYGLRICGWSLRLATCDFNFQPARPGFPQPHDDGMRRWLRDGSVRWRLARRIQVNGSTRNTSAASPPMPSKA